MPVIVCGHRVTAPLVVGYGVTGRAVVQFAVHRGMAAAVSERGDLSPKDRLALDGWGVLYEAGRHTVALLEGCDAVIPSPGVHADHPILLAANERGLPTFSELDLAAAAYGASPTVAVTGTNGKSTVVSLIGAILEWHGLRAPVVGNIGDPFIALVDSGRPSDVAVIEVSSYQLEQSVCFRPRVGVLLNLTPDHLEHHGSLEAYAAAKGRLFVWQQPRDTAILPQGEAVRFPQGRGHRVLFGDETPLPDWTSDLAPHNRANLRAAYAAADALLGAGCSTAVPPSALRSAFSLPYRMEPLGEVDGVLVINDSKSTNADSSVAAIRAVRAPTILLLGGHFKGGGYEALGEALRDSLVRHVVLFGKAASQLETFVARAGIPYTMEGRLVDATGAALDQARSGEIVLLSPGCSSFDEFSDYMDRGRTFALLVAESPGFRPAAGHKDTRPDESGQLSPRE